MSLSCKSQLEGGFITLAASSLRTPWVQRKVCDGTSCGCCERRV